MILLGGGFFCQIFNDLLGPVLDGGFSNQRIENYSFFSFLPWCSEYMNGIKILSETFPEFLYSLLLQSKSREK